MPTQAFSGNIELTYGNEEESGTLYLTGGFTDSIAAGPMA